MHKICCCQRFKNEVRVAFKRSYGFKTVRYWDTMIFLDAEGFKFPQNVKEI